MTSRPRSLSEWTRWLPSSSIGPSRLYLREPEKAQKAVGPAGLEPERDDWAHLGVHLAGSGWASTAGATGMALIRDKPRVL